MGRRMDKQAISDRLRALASDDEARSKAARLRDVIDDVEVALAAGVPRSLVLKELKDHGLDLSLSTFDTSLKRIRAKRRIQNTDAVSADKPVAERKAMSNHPDPSRQSHDPAELDRIMQAKPDLAGLAKLAKRSKK